MRAGLWLFYNNGVHASHKRSVWAQINEDCLEAGRDLGYNILYDILRPAALGRKGDWEDKG